MFSKRDYFILITIYSKSMFTDIYHSKYHVYTKAIRLIKTVGIVANLTWIDELQWLSEQQTLAVFTIPTLNCSPHRLLPLKNETYSFLEILKTYHNHVLCQME
jgi:hypothetical protein